MIDQPKKEGFLVRSQRRNATVNETLVAFGSTRVVPREAQMNRSVGSR